MATKQKLKQVLTNFAKKKVLSLRKTRTPRKQKAILKAEMEEGSFFHE